MSETRTSTETGPASTTESAPRWLRIIAALGTDVGVALLWAALVVAIVLFSGVVSQFAYVDF